MTANRQAIIVENILAANWQRRTVQRNKAVRIVIFDDLVEAVVNDRNTGRQGIRQRTAHGAFEARLVVRTVGDLAIAFQLLRRFATDVVEQPSCRVAAEQCALRSLQYFDTFQIKHAE